MKIAKAAINSSKLVESTKTGHVTYDIYYWDSGDENTSGYWYYGGSGSTDAKITGTVSTNSKLKLKGESAATVGDVTNESWEAYPPVPAGDYWTDYRPTSDIAGTGQGLITSGNSKNVKVNGKLVAIVGSEVRTCLDTITTIEDGSEVINI